MPSLSGGPVPTPRVAVWCLFQRAAPAVLLARRHLMSTLQRGDGQARLTGLLGAGPGRGVTAGAGAPLMLAPGRRDRGGVHVPVQDQGAHPGAVCALGQAQLCLTAPHPAHVVDDEKNRGASRTCPPAETPTTQWLHRPPRTPAPTRSAQAASRAGPSSTRCADPSPTAASREASGQPRRPRLAADCLWFSAMSATTWFKHQRLAPAERANQPA
jgi:hypothetical protein